MNLEKRECGCQITHAGIKYCSLHRVAPDLYKACKVMHKRFIPQTPDDSKALLDLWQAIAKVEGK